MKKILTSFVFTSLVISQCSAAVIFDLRDTASTTEIESGTILRSGITATIIANDGALNQTSSSFGINAAGSGDDSALIDDGSGVTEYITVSFDQDVILHSISLELFSAGETAELNIAGTITSLTDTGVGKDVFNAPANTTLLSSESVVLTWTNGNGFSFSEFSVAAVPEPSSTLLLSLGLLGLLIRRRA